MAEGQMKILFCNYEYPPLGGGGGVMNAMLAEELAKNHQVTILTSQGLDLPRESVVNGVKVIRVPVFFRKHHAAANLHSLLAFIPIGIWFGRKLLQESQFDIINTHFVMPTGPVGDVLARSAGIPNVLTLHGGDLYDPSKFTSPHRHPYLRVWIRWLIRKAEVIVGQSQNTLDNMRRYYTPEIKGIRIPLGIRRPDYGVALRSEYGFTDEDILLVTVGRLIPRKAVHQLIAMMGKFGDAKVKLLILGNGPEEGVLKEATQKAGISDQVHFMGFVDEADKFRILGMSDLYVSTSQHEGFCLSFLEAMSAGLPIVCYDNGGHTDYLKDQVNGFLVPLNDLEQFGERCKQLVENAGLRKKYGENNCQLIEEYYLDACAARYETLFSQTIALKRKAEQVSLYQSPSAGLD
jgi:glycosyltransferase involved in cell wall biosynthesis